MNRDPMSRLIFVFGLIWSAGVSVQLMAAPPVTAAAITPDGAHAVLGSQAGIEVRTWPDMTIVASISTELEHVHDLSFSPDGETLLAAGGSPSEDGAVEVVHWADRSLVRRVAGHADVIYHVAWSPDGKRWSTSSGDHTCRIFDATSGALITIFDGHSRAVLGICFLSNQETIASVGADQTIRLWDSTTGKHLRTLDNHVDIVNAISARPNQPDGSASVVATISEDRTVRFWQPVVGRLTRFVRLPSPPRAMAWSRTGDQLLVGSNDGHVRMVDPESAEILKDLSVLEGRIHEVVADPDGTRFLVAGEAGFRVVEPD